MGVNSKPLVCIMTYIFNGFYKRKVTIQGVKITTYLIGDSTYPLRTYLQKNWKSHNSNDVSKKRYDSNMNFVRVIIILKIGL